MITKFDAVNERFKAMDQKLDSLICTVRILGVVIVGATLGEFGIFFLQIYKTIWHLASI